MYTACWCSDKILVDLMDRVTSSWYQRDGRQRSSEVTYSSRRNSQLLYKRRCLLNLTSINFNNDEHHFHFVYGKREYSGPDFLRTFLFPNTY